MTSIKLPPLLQTTFRFSDNGRPVRLVRSLRCPNCQAELRAEDVGADPFGEVVMVCSTCALQILTVG
jgi:hypothetical protein